MDRPKGCTVRRSTGTRRQPVGDDCFYDANDPRRDSGLAPGC